MWVAAFSVVPRHQFMRRFFAPAPGRRHEAVGDDHVEWLDMAYRDAAWPTQLDGEDDRWDEARRHGPILGEPTCSTDKPSLTAAVLEALDVHTGLRVLQVGTGTGYTAALLAHRLGEDHVVSVEVDPELALRARHDLRSAGYMPVVAADSGLDGYPAAAPYDRIVSTCAVDTVPAAWLQQVRPGGIILTNLHRGLTGSALVRLTVRSDGSASGRLLDDSGTFLPERGAQVEDPLALIQSASVEDAVPRPIAVAPLSDDGEAWVALADLMMRGVMRVDTDDDSGPLQWMVHADGSWARHEHRSGLVHQGGRRRLWDDLERLHATWTAAGSPGRHRIGLTVTCEGEHQVWIRGDTTFVELDLGPDIRQ